MSTHRATPWRRYNPFYALLGARLCAGHREVKFALHFALWDAFKEVAQQPLTRSANTARLLAQLLSREALPAAVLKVVQWERLGEREIFFWQACFVELLGGAAGRAARALRPLAAPELAATRDGALLFCERHMRPLVRRAHPALVAPLRALVAALSEAD